MINDGPAVLVEHRPEWSASAEQLLDDLRVALSTAAFEEPTAWSVDHIGSTSVPGLAAKNIIDLQIRLRVLPDDNALRGLLAPFGYLPSAGSRPDSPGVTRDDPCGDVSLPDEVWDKRLFVRPDSGQQVVLHVRPKRLTLRLAHGVVSQLAPRSIRVSATATKPSSDGWPTSMPAMPTTTTTRAASHATSPMCAGLWRLGAAGNPTLAVHRAGGRHREVQPALSDPRGRMGPWTCRTAAGGEWTMATPLDLFDHAGPWTEEEFLALPEDRRIELLDGELLVTPSANHAHQRLSLRLAMAIDTAAPAGFEVLEAINVRLAIGRILIPDLAVITTPGVDSVVSDAHDVALVVEIVSPGSVVTDRAVKPQLYAAAGIPSYLRIELGRDGPAAVAYRLRDGRYVEESRAAPGAVLSLHEPFPLDVDLASLISGRRPR